MFGHKIRVDPNMVVTEIRVTELTWRQRLLSWPWRPFTVIKTEVHTKPAPFAYHTEDGTMVMHPATLEALKNGRHRSTQEHGHSDLDN